MREEFQLSKSKEQRNNPSGEFTFPTPPSGALWDCDLINGQIILTLKKHVCAP